MKKIAEKKEVTYNENTLLEYVRKKEGRRRVWDLFYKLSFVTLKGQCHEIFVFKFFFLNSWWKKPEAKNLVTLSLFKKGCCGHFSNIWNAGTLNSSKGIFRRVVRPKPQLQLPSGWCTAAKVLQCTWWCRGPRHISFHASPPYRYICLKRIFLVITTNSIEMFLNGHWGWNVWVVFFYLHFYIVV